MELLLNLCWLVLVVPAFWMWHRQPRSAPRANPLACLLALSCVLVLLFPVISESDDLHVMRQELEEINLKVRAGVGEKTFQSSARLHVPPAAVLGSAGIESGETFLGLTDSYGPHSPLIRAVTPKRDRAPPIPIL